VDYLVTVWDGGGSVPPELALVRSLVRSGHRVVVLAGPPLRDGVEAAGAEFRSWRKVPHRRDAADPDPFDDTGMNSPPAMVRFLLDRLVVAPARDYATEVGAVLDERRFDALVSSMFMLGAMVAAQARTLPYAVAVPNCYVRPCPGMPPFGTGWRPARGPIDRARHAAVNQLGQRLWDRGLREFNALRAHLGLAPLRHLFDQHDEAARVLLLTSQAFDFPGRLPPNVRYVGPQLDDPVWVKPVDPPPGDRPLVLVGMSSTFQDQADLLRRVVAALSTLPVRAVVTTGPEIDPGEVPGTESIHVVRSAPHSVLLRHTAAVVSHGGHGTVIKALAAGVPQLVIPIGRDQPGNAARVDTAGVGLRLRRSAPPGQIADAVRRLLAEPAFRARAAELGAVVATDAASTTAIEELEAMATPPTR
jgi:MGT family glycosyltransferase